MLINNETQYDEALREVEKYFDNEPERDTPEAVRFEELIEAIVAYEEIHYPMS